MVARLMMLGKMVGREVLKPNVVNVRVVDQVYDDYLHMYFATPKDFKAHEAGHKVNMGDLVRIEKLNEKLTVELEYKVGEVVFPIGRAVDPVTGRRCRGTKFIDDQARAEEAKRITNAKLSENYPL